MKNNCLSVISIVFSIIAILVAIFRSAEFGIDYQSLLIGVLSILVTVLIGWQIYDHVMFKKKIDELIKKQIYEEREDIKNQINTAVVGPYSMQVTFAATSKDWNTAILLASVVLNILDTLTGVEDYYTVLADTIKKVYTQKDVNIKEEYKHKLMDSLEKNLENSKAIRDVYFWLKQEQKF